MSASRCGATVIARPIGTRLAVMGSTGADRKAGSIYSLGRRPNHDCARCGVPVQVRIDRPTNMCRDCRVAVKVEAAEVARLRLTGDPRTPRQIATDAAADRARQAAAARARRWRPAQIQPGSDPQRRSDLAAAYARQRTLIDRIVRERLS